MVLHFPDACCILQSYNAVFAFSLLCWLYGNYCLDEIRSSLKRRLFVYWLWTFFFLSTSVLLCFFFFVEQQFTYYIFSIPTVVWSYAGISRQKKVLRVFLLLSVKQTSEAIYNVLCSKRADVLTPIFPFFTSVFPFFGWLACSNDGRSSAVYCGTAWTSDVLVLPPLLRRSYWSTIHWGGGHQSLCSLCKTEESSWRLRVCSSAIDVEFLPHDEIYDHIILSHQTAVSVLHKHELMIILHLILNEKIWIRKSIWEKSFWHVTSCSVCVCVCCGKLKSSILHIEYEYRICAFFISAWNYWFFFFSPYTAQLIQMRRERQCGFNSSSIKLKHYMMFKECVRDAS